MQSNWPSPTLLRMKSLGRRRLAEAVDGQIDTQAPEQHPVTPVDRMCQVIRAAGYEAMGCRRVMRANGLGRRVSPSVIDRFRFCKGDLWTSVGLVTTSFYRRVGRQCTDFQTFPTSEPDRVAQFLKEREGARQ